MFRVSKESEAEALSRLGAISLDNGKKRMSGMVFVDEAQYDDTYLKEWVALTLSFVGELPAK